jgi:hypothetical protein
MKQAIIEALRNEQLTHTELAKRLNESLRGQIFGQCELLCRDR